MGVMIPEGWVLEGDSPVPPTPRRSPLANAPRIVPVPNAADVIRAIYPNVQITDWARDPNSRLGRANPNSWHVRSHAAIDNRPLPGMTYEQFRQGIEDRGYHIIEGIDEVHHPSRHATGPHWHDVIGYDPSNPPLDPTANMREQSGDAPAGGVAIPQGWQLESPAPQGPRPDPLARAPRLAGPSLSTVPAPALPGGPGLYASAPPPDPDTQAAIQSLAPPPTPRFQTGPLVYNRAGVTQQAQAATAGAPPPPTGYVADPNNVASEHSAPANRVPTAQVTTRDDPRLAGLNAQWRAMVEDPRHSNEEVAVFAEQHGITNENSRGSLANVMRWRSSPEFGRWLRAPERERHHEFVNLDDINLPEGQYREVTTPGNVPQASITNAPPPRLSQRIATAIERIPVAAGVESERSAAVHAQQNAQIFEHPLSPVRAVEDAQDYNERYNRATAEGRHLDAAGDQAGGLLAMAGIVPIVGRGKAGVQLAARSLEEIGQLAARNGIREAGPAADAAIARLVQSQWSDLTPGTREILDTVRTENGQLAPLTAAHLSDLRVAANPPPSLLGRAMRAVRDRLGQGETPPRAVDRIDIPPSPRRPEELWTQNHSPADAPGEDPFSLSQDEHDDLMGVTPEELDRHAQTAWEHFRAKEIGAYRASDEATAHRDGGAAPWIGNEHDLINRMMDEIEPSWREPDRLAIPPASAAVDVPRPAVASPPLAPPAPAGLLPPRLSAGGREVVGALPPEGVAPANVGTDGRLYVGGMGQAHFDVIQQYPEGVWTGETGFVTPDGQFLNRTEALAHVNGNGERIRPSENMRGGPGGDELDALDYRDQSHMVPPPEWSARRAEWERQAAERRGAQSMAMGADRGASLSGAPRVPDRIDVGSVQIPEGWQLEDPLGRVQPIGEQPAPEVMADLARSIRPEDVVPIPGNRVETADEAAQANPGTFRNVEAPDPATMLEMRSVRRWDGRTARFRGPLDAESFLRSRGGIADTDGELRHIGITNNYGRSEVPGEAKLGPISHPGGMPLDEAGRLLHEAGYLPARPTTADVVDILRESRLGRRLWHPSDLREVAGFEGAQAQHEAVDAAAQAGAPLAERIGAPVGPADLNANDPPATAYEDLPRIGPVVGNINLAHIESGADIGRLLDTVERQFGGFDAARRGVVSHAETEALASELGMTADDLLRRRRGQALNGEQALAARQLLAKSSDEVIALASHATGPEASDVSRAAFSEALLRHAAIHEQVTGAVAEAGRALSAMRIAARSRAISGDIHQAAVAGLGGQKRLEEVAQEILNLHRDGVDLGQINRYAVRAAQPRFRDKLIELYYNSLLSGPRTHAVNIMSNMMTAALQIPEHATAAGLGLVRRGAGALFGKADDFDRVMASEIGQRTFGLMQGAGEGLRAFARTARTGDVADAVTKVEARTQHAISGVKGSILRTPTRLLAAEDEFFKAIGRRMELNGLAVRQARAEGLRGEALRDRIADLSTNPTDEMVAQSMDYARYITFQRPLEQGSLAQSISTATQNRPWLKLFIPFVRTPANLLKFAAERSPAALIFKSVRTDFAAGGARRDLAVARMMLGTGLAMTVAELASRGVITGGGPADRGALDLMRGDGWQPYSIRIGDQYYSYARMDPISTTIGITADMVDFQSHMTANQRAQAGPLIIASIMRNLGNKTWLSGLSDLVEAAQAPPGQNRLSALVARLGGSIAVPAIVSQAAGIMDPTMRDTRGPAATDPTSDPLGVRSTFNQTVATIQSRLPGLSQNLPARLDVWGHPITREGALGPDIISPFSTSTAHNDPITAELLNLGASIGRPAGQIRGVRLTPEQAGQYAEMSGRYIRGDLASSMADPSWAGMTTDERLSEIESIKRNARADARADLGLDGSVQIPAGWQLAH